MLPSRFPWLDHLTQAEWRELTILLGRRDQGMIDPAEAQRLRQLKRRAHPPIYRDPPTPDVA